MRVHYSTLGIRGTGGPITKGEFAGYSLNVPLQWVYVIHDFEWNCWVTLEKTGAQSLTVVGVDGNPLDRVAGPGAQAHLRNRPVSQSQKSNLGCGGIFLVVVIGFVIVLYLASSR